MRGAGGLGQGLGRDRRGGLGLVLGAGHGVAGDRHAAVQHGLVGLGQHGQGLGGLAGLGAILDVQRVESGRLAVGAGAVRVALVVRDELVLLGQRRGPDQHVRVARRVQLLVLAVAGEDEAEAAGQGDLLHAVGAVQEVGAGDEVAAEPERHVRADRRDPLLELRPQVGLAVGQQEELAVPPEGQRQPHVRQVAPLVVAGRPGRELALRRQPELSEGVQFRVTGALQRRQKFTEIAKLHGSRSSFRVDPRLKRVGLPWPGESCGTLQPHLGLCAPALLRTWKPRILLRLTNPLV